MVDEKQKKYTAIIVIVIKTTMWYVDKPYISCLSFHGLFIKKLL